jgi:hypothetical protein
VHHARVTDGCARRCNRGAREGRRARG